MTHQEYTDYIHSDAWRSVRERYFLEIKPTSCAGCGRPARHDFNLHHITYKNLGHEKNEDLVLLCYKCHKSLHDSLKQARRVNPYLKVETHSKRFLELMAIARGVPRPQQSKPTKRKKKRKKSKRK